MILRTSRFLAATFGKFGRAPTKRRRFFASRTPFLADLLSSSRKFTRRERTLFSVERISFEFKFKLIY